MPRFPHRAPRIPFALAFALALALALPSTAPAQTGTARISVQLVDTTGRPVPGGQVRVSGVPAPVFSDSAGRAEVRGIPAGSRLVTFAATGFGTERALIRFDPGAAIPARVTLRPAIALDTLNVLAARRAQALARAGFFERQRVGLGRFITRAQIDSAGAFGPDLAPVLRGVRGFTVDYLPNGRMTLTARRGMDSLQGRCAPAIFVDDLESDLEVLGNLTPGEVEAIEAYPDAATTPQQYNRCTGCGAIVVWTRRE